LDGIRFVKESGLKDYVLVTVSVEKLNDSWSTDKDYYIGPGGTLNTIGNRYNRFKEFLQTHQPIEASRVGFDWKGNVTFGNGRHRFSVLRDIGLDRIPIAVHNSDAKEFKRRFGV